MKKISLGLLALLFIISACRKQDHAVSLVIEGIVKDSLSNELQDSVKVELFTQSSAHVVYSDRNGYYNLGKYSVGDYTIVYSKKGYISASQQVVSPDYLSSSDYGYSIVKSLVTYLTPANEEAIFTVYRQYLDGEPLAAANFPYTINLGGANPSITGTTDGNGIVSQPNMPQTFSFSVDYTFNGIRYKTSTIFDTHTGNSVVVYGYNPEASLGVVTTNVLDSQGQSVNGFNINDHPVVQFTLPVDTAQASFQLLEDGWSKVAVAHRWSNGQMKLEIIPSSALLSATFYSLSFSMENADHTQTLSKVYSFTTK